MKRLFLLALLLSPTTLRADEPAPSYTRDVKPFLEKYCTECHNSNNAKAGVRLESYDDLFKPSKKGRKLLVAGKPDDSRLLHTMEGKAKQMPPRKSVQPKSDEVKLVRAWIAAGAKKDTDKKTDGEKNQEEARSELRLPGLPPRRTEP
jgi:hypothetical protein